MLKFITDAIEGNARPRKTPNDTILLKHGHNYKVLVDATGSLTKAGSEYERLTDNSLETFSYDPQQAPKRNGNMESIKLSGGKERLVRTFDPTAENGRGSYRYTALGKKFFAKRKVEYVVRVPAVFTGKRSNGLPYRREGLFPIHNPVSVPATYNQAQRDAHIKTHVSNSFDGGIITEFSEEQIKYNAGGQWSIVEMITSPTALDQPNVVDRHLGAFPGSVSTLPFPDAIVETAFDDADDRLCCVRQISAVTKVPIKDIMEKMDECEHTIYGTNTWREKGVTGKMIFEYAKQTGRGACMLHNGNAIDVLPGPTPLVFAVLESHAYFYADVYVRKRLMKRVAPIATKIRRHGRESTTPDATQWEVFQWPPKPGHYYVDEHQIDFIRELFLRENKHPKVILKDEAATKSLHYIFTKADAEKGTCVIHAMPVDGLDIMDWLRRLDIGMAYRGEGLPSVAYKVLNKLLREKERSYLDGEEKHQLMEAHGYACASCGDRGKFEWDHTVRLSQSYGEQGPSAFAPRCPQCHATKTSDEPREFDTCPLESNVDQHIWDQYVLSDRLPPLIYKNEHLEDTNGCQMCDVRRCRMRALLLNVHPIPVISPLDNIEQMQGTELGDLNFVTKKSTNFIKQLGYTGSGWQHRILTEWLLYTGVICWQDISHKICAQGHLPADVLKKPLERMEEAWGDIGLGKQSINSMIGVWMLDECHSYKLISSNNPGDAPKDSLKRTVFFQGGSITDYIMKTQMRSVSTLRPLHDLAMSCEATRVGHMLYCLQKQKATIYEVKTDSCLYRLPNIAKEVLKDITFNDLKLRSRFESRKCINQYYDPCIPDSDMKVYRVTEASQTDLLKMDPGLPKSAGTMAMTPIQWRELSEAEAIQSVLAGQNLFIRGIAGTGKTHFALKLIENLKSLNKKVDIIAKTHTASARAGGVTADHYVRRSILHGCCSADVIWVEEVSQVECALWAQLNKVNVQFIMTGDMNQFPPVFDSWRSCIVQEGKLAASRMFHRMAGGNVTTLTICRRSDTFLFEFYGSIIEGGSRFHLNLADVVEEARTLFKYNGICHNNLCISHAKRCKINKEVNLALKPDKAIFLRATAVKGQVNAAQHMWLWEGMDLIGCASGVKKGIRNNVLYTIVKIEDDGIIVKGDEEISLSFAQVASVMRLSFARTYASCQGTEFETALRLHDTNNRYFTMRHLFVGMSRCKYRNKLDIA